MSKISIVVVCCAGVWTASVFKGDTCHCEARSIIRDEAIASVVAIFRLA